MQTPHRDLTTLASPAQQLNRDEPMPVQKIIHTRHYKRLPMQWCLGKSAVSRSRSGVNMPMPAAALAAPWFCTKMSPFLTAEAGPTLGIDTPVTSSPQFRAQSQHQTPTACKLRPPVGGTLAWYLWVPPCWSDNPRPVQPPNAAAQARQHQQFNACSIEAIQPRPTHLLVRHNSLFYVSA